MSGDPTAGERGAAGGLPYKNGVSSAGASRPGHHPGSFALRLSKGRIPGRLEGALAAAVIAAVIGVAFLIVQMPGALVVQVRDDTGSPVPDSRVSCTSPSGDLRESGVTDVFGEAKWPGLVKGPWRCEVLPPDRFHSERQLGSVVVEARHPSFVRAVVERPARLVVRVQRPSGAPRAAIAVRAVCAAAGGSVPPASWEARAGILDGSATLWLPHGQSCRIGLVRPELPARQPGPVTQPVLDCAGMPCAGPLSGGAGEELSAQLSPRRDQWEAARPPPEPDPAGR